MTDDLRKEHVYTEDGRKAEKIIREVMNVASEDKTIVTELYVEPKIEKRLSHRVTEHSRPIVHKREVEVVDETSGEIMERRVESMYPEVKMELREHLGLASSVASQGSEEDCTVTRGELKELLQSVMCHSHAHQEPVMVRNLQAEVGERLEQPKSGVSATAVFLWAVIIAQVAALAYVGLFM